MGRISNRSWIILAALVAFVHFGTPLLAELFFELYHLMKFELLYSVYGLLRYLTAQFMFWSNRWIVTLLAALIGLVILWFRQHRRAKAEAAT